MHQCRVATKYTLYTERICTYIFRRLRNITYTWGNRVYIVRTQLCTLYVHILYITYAVWPFTRRWKPIPSILSLPHQRGQILTCQLTSHTPLYS
jgi:hypothetical protein